MEYIPFQMSIISWLIKIAKRFWNRPAISVDDKTYTYRELFHIAGVIGSKIEVFHEPRCLILSSRNITAYTGLLATLLAGKAYVFLNPKDISSRLLEVINQVDTNLLITDGLHDNLISHLESQSGRQFQKFYSEQIHKVNTLSDLNYHKPAPYIYRYVYIIFTSGTTGKPKGVPISHQNLNAFLANIISRVRPDHYSRFSQINELTFDFSIYDIFTAWSVGACLCVLPERYKLKISDYIKNNQITHWASVPSLIQFLKKSRVTSIFETIRYSVFCGETLTLENASLWKQAAPNTMIDNLYGPTEATVAISGYRWDGDTHCSMMPIGNVFPHQGYLMLGEKNLLVKKNEMGELCLYGTQVFSSYWRNEEESSKRLLLIDGIRVYKTGDLVIKDKQRRLVYKGRIDDQYKIRGYRVEKLEIENLIKSITGTNIAAVVINKNKLSHCLSPLHFFISGTDKTEKELLKVCREKMPDHLLPKQIIKLHEMPYTKNGKIDYQRLERLIVTQHEMPNIEETQC